MEEFANILTESIKDLRDANVRSAAPTSFDVPIFEPDRDDDGAAKWCDDMEKLGETFNWSSYELLVRSNTGLAGEAREWFSTWKPLDKSWEEFRRELFSLYPAKRNLNEKLRKASQYTSKDAKSYCMEALETCISYWEDALAVYRSKDSGGGPLAMLSPEEAGFCKDLQLLLDSAIELQENSEMLFLDERSVLFRPESGRDANGIDTDLSGGESFASAQDQVADLKEFEEFSDYFPDLESYPLYQMALRQLENGGIPCRTLRTEVVKCGSDGEYLAKLHCLRLAFQHLLRDPANYVWFADAGRQILADMMLYADKDPKDFLIGYEEILQYIQDPKQWRDLEEELSTRGVKALTFYDVVLDYILMDAFEDLESPPSSVMAVIQNRWLSKGFKETALTTAVWSVLKAKRRRLKFSNGFMAHFYTISEQLSPLLAWGFLGSDESLRDTCVYFKEQVMGFLSDIFSFQKCRFVTVDDLAADVHSNLRVRIDNICQRLCVQA